MDDLFKKYLTGYAGAYALIPRQYIIVQSQEPLCNQATNNAGS